MQSSWLEECHNNFGFRWNSIELIFAWIKTKVRRIQWKLWRIFNEIKKNGRNQFVRFSKVLFKINFLYFTRLSKFFQPSFFFSLQMKHKEYFLELQKWPFRRGPTRLFHSVVPVPAPWRDRKSARISKPWSVDADSDDACLQVHEHSNLWFHDRPQAEIRIYYFRRNLTTKSNIFVKHFPWNFPSEFQFSIIFLPFFRSS